MLKNMRKDLHEEIKLLIFASVILNTIFLP